MRSFADRSKQTMMDMVNADSGMGPVVWCSAGPVPAASLPPSCQGAVDREPESGAIRAALNEALRQRLVCLVARLPTQPSRVIRDPVVLFPS